MKIPLPSLAFSQDIKTIHSNRDAISEARAALNAALKALDGLSKANQGMCKHSRKEKHYDPGYAGGGYRHSECKDCGANIY